MALTRWLGRLWRGELPLARVFWTDMLLVGTLTTLGLTIIGVPSSLALGFIAGIAEFIPMVGPFLAAIPALLVGLSEGCTTMLWVAFVFILVQQTEGNLITPLIQRRR